MNNEMAYLLGMITGNGTIQRGKTETTVEIELPHKKLQSDLFSDLQLCVKASITDIRNILEPLTGATLDFAQGKSKTVLSFTCRNREYLMREILRFIDCHTSHETMRIPREMFRAPVDQKKAFLKGFGDATAYIRRSNYYYEKFAHRVYVEIPHNWELVVDYCNLLKSIDIPVQCIDWAHPNMRDPQLKEYRKEHTNFWKKEHQVKIWAALYKEIGFYVIHKDKALAKLAQEHLDNISPAKEKGLHRFYWETTTRLKAKPPHPGETDPFIPSRIRGNHYDSWQKIAYDMGYKSDEA